MFGASPAQAEPLSCSLTGYQSSPGLTAAVADDTLALTWDGDPGQEVRLRLMIVDGTPTIRDLAVRRKGTRWTTLANDVRPEFRVASGLRRITNQQLRPLQALGVDITAEIVDEEKWDAFWDAPLNVPGGDAAHGNSTPPLEGLDSQPGLPRMPEEVTRADAKYRAEGCEVTTNGARLEVTFPGVELGVFAGRLQYTVFRGTNLIRQEVIATTDEPSVAYKYEAGLGGLAIEPASRMVWRDISNLWQDYEFGGAPNDSAVALKSSNRLVVAEVPGGAIAAFPPPHNFFFAREIEFNLGLHLVPQGQRDVVLVRRPAGRRGGRAVRSGPRGRGHPPELRAAQRKAGNLAADARLLLCQRRARRGHAGVGPGLHPRRHLQAARGPPGHGHPLPYEVRAAAAGVRPGYAAARYRRAEGGRHQHPGTGRELAGARSTAEPGRLLRGRPAAFRQGLPDCAERGGLLRQSRRAQRRAAVEAGLLDAGPRRGGSRSSRSIRRTARCTT